VEDLHFDSTDLAETEEFLVKAYTTMRIGGRSDGARTRIDRRWVGPVSMDTLSFGFDMQFNVRPLNKILIGRVHSGRIESRFADVRDIFGPGDVRLIAPPDQPYAGQVCHATYDATMFDTDQLNRVASPASGVNGADVKLTGHRPVSKEAGERLSGLIGYLRDSVLTDPDCRRSPLVASTATMHLASVVLDTFPTNAQVETTVADRQSGRAILLRKAIAFIDDAAHTDISIVDIARHVNMTPRGVQYMFRRELDCTPMEYTRRVRLDHARRELVAASSDTSTVAQIAARWGFAHKGRFARSYRQAYGESPHETLLR
jgi:AraC-like DNA-binding protein